MHREKVYIFGKEIKRRIHLWHKILHEKLYFWENHKQNVFCPNLTWTCRNILV